MIMQRVSSVIPATQPYDSHVFVECGNTSIYKVIRHTSVRLHNHYLCDYLGSRLAEWINLKVRGYTLLKACPAIHAFLGPVIGSRGAANNSAPGGIYLGTQLADQHGQSYNTSLLPEPHLGRVRNLSSFAGALALDVWAGCAGNRNFVYTQADKSGHYEVHFENYRSSFGGADLRFPSISGAPVSHQPGAYSYVDGWDSFEPYLSRLHLSDAQSLWEIIETLPHVWVEALTQHSLERLVVTLCRRRSTIHSGLVGIRDNNPDIFPNWKRRVAVYGSTCMKAEFSSGAIHRTQPNVL